MGNGKVRQCRQGTGEGNLPTGDSMSIEYKCENCGKEIEFDWELTDEPCLNVCPTCYDEIIEFSKKVKWSVLGKDGKKYSL